MKKQKHDTKRGSSIDKLKERAGAVLEQAGEKVEEAGLKVGEAGERLMKYGKTLVHKDEAHREGHGR